MDRGDYMEGGRGLGGYCVGWGWSLVAGFWVFCRFGAGLGPVWALRFLAFLQRGLAGLVVVRAFGEPGGRFLWL